MASKERMVTGVLVGTAASEARAREIADRFRACPYASLFASSGTAVVGVFGMPESRRWWLEWPEQHPEVMGLESAIAFLADRLVAPSAWTCGEVPESGQAPCGADCSECEKHGQMCAGCPAGD